MAERLRRPIALPLLAVSPASGAPAVLAYRPGGGDTLDRRLAEFLGPQALTERARHVPGAHP